MIANNKKAYFEYHILEEYIAGLKLVGSEVKSMHDGNVNITEAYIYIVKGEAYVKNMFIEKYAEASHTNHEERRDRKLLLTKKQILEIAEELKQKGVAVIPLSVFSKDGKYRIKIGIAKGKKAFDKRESIKNRDIERDLRRNGDNY